MGRYLELARAVIEAGAEKHQAGREISERSELRPAHTPLHSHNSLLSQSERMKTQAEPLDALAGLDREPWPRDRATPFFRCAACWRWFPEPALRVVEERIGRGFRCVRCLLGEARS